MNYKALLTAALAASLLSGSSEPARAADGQPIDLRKPVSESFRPDGFYWAFDDGILGEGQPSQVDDLSGNGFVGAITKVSGKPPMTYAEGKFGTGVYAQGMGGIVDWSEKSRLNAAPDLTKLTACDRPFTGGVWFKMDDRRPGMHALIRMFEGPAGWRICVVKEVAKGSPNELDTDLSAQSQGDSWVLDLQIGDSRAKGRSKAATAAFADGHWHHVGFSVASEKSEGAAPGTRQFSVTYWLDGEVFDTVQFQAVWADPEPGGLWLRAGYRVWGVLDDAFVTSGIHAFKK